MIASRMLQHPTHKGFFTALSSRSRLMLMGFIFFVFAPASILVISPFKHDRSLLCLTAYALMGGFTAVGYAYSFLHDLRVLFVVIPAQILWFIMPQWFPKDFRAGFTPSMEGGLLVAMIVTAYVLFVAFFRREGIRTIRMQTELALAAGIHAELVPPLERRLGPVEVYGKSIAGAEMGGDLIDLVCSDGNTDVFVADVSGHGVKAGVIMAVLKSSLHTRLRIGGELSDVFEDVNAVVCDLAGAGMFVTAAGLRLKSGGRVLFCGAGHGPILHYRAGSRSVFLLESQSLPLGVVEKQSFEVSEISCQVGDVFLLMTDGMTEVFSSNGEMLGQESIVRLYRENARRPLAGIYEAIMALVRSHGPQSDDQTLMLARIIDS